MTTDFATFCTVIPDPRGNAALLLCARAGAVIDRKRMAAKATDVAAAVAEAQAAFPNREVRLFL